jgi:hypothetical protein
VADEDVSYWREKAEEMLRLAKATSNPERAAVLKALAASYLAAIGENAEPDKDEGSG